MIASVKRVLCWYELYPAEAFVAEAELNGASLEDLQALFQVEETNPMYDCWKVEERHVRALERWVTVPINLKSYSYFLEAESA